MKNFALALCVLAVARLATADVQCDSTHECPNGQTCCKLKSGQWGCCPLPKAVCCSDGVHCCPNGYTCHASTGKCEKGPITLPWLQKLPAVVKPAPQQPEKVESVQCDSTHECPNSQTCCKLKSGQWGCCPLPQAVCCSDGVHCCPNGYTCHASTGKCEKGPITLPWLQKQPAIEKPAPQEPKNVESVQCDSTHECPNSQTCCKLKSGQWGCCPLPQAVCCSDGVHCCPNGYTCHASTGKCEKGPITLPWLQKQPAIEKPAPQEPKNVESVQCDSTHECPNSQTCCKLKSGQWGCCPLPQAVCCSDGVHCCPNGYTCHASTGKCEKGPITLPWLQKLPAVVKSESVDSPLLWEPEKVESVQCDSTHECPDGQTCCKLKSGQWGCCPLPQAVCCSDGVHCCPNGYTCDTSSGKCEKGPITLPWLQKLPAVVKPAPQEPEKVESVQCDSTHECPNSQTCCKLKSGQWGCCPLPQAVCCSDGVHCCPNGYTCDTSSGKCEKGPITLPWLQKQPAVVKPAPQEPEQVESVQCDSTHECPNGQTCCKLKSGQWGCCPLAQAVCCSDGVHCCPNGYTCHASTGKCEKGSITLPWLQKQSAIVKSAP